MGDKNIGIVHILIVFRAMNLDEIIKLEKCRDRVLACANI